MLKSKFVSARAMEKVTKLVNNSFDTARAQQDFYCGLRGSEANGTAFYKISGSSQIYSTVRRPGRMEHILDSVQSPLVSVESSRYVKSAATSTRPRIHQPKEDFFTLPRKEQLTFFSKSSRDPKTGISVSFKQRVAS